MFISAEVASGFIGGGIVRRHGWRCKRAALVGKVAMNDDEGDV